jgi:hypothetical protein
LSASSGEVVSFHALGSHFNAPSNGVAHGGPVTDYAAGRPKEKNRMFVVEIVVLVWLLGVLSIMALQEQPRT